MKTKYITRFLLIMSIVLINTLLIQAQTLSGLNNSTYIENAAPITVGPSLAVTGGNGYGGGYILFDLTNGTVNDQLGVTSDADPNASGAISFSGGNLYLGNGSGKDVVGSIDAAENGVNGQNLKINFTSNFSNSSFENGIGGWTVSNQWVDLGVTQIAGYTSPEDLTYPAYSGGDGVAPGYPYGGRYGYYTPTFSYEISTSQYSEGFKSLRLYSSMTTSTGYDVVHGPCR